MSTIAMIQEKTLENLVAEHRLRRSHQNRVVVHKVQLHLQDPRTAMSMEKAELTDRQAPCQSSKTST